MLKLKYLNFTFKQIYKNAELMFYRMTFIPDFLD